MNGSMMRFAIAAGLAALVGIMAPSAHAALGTLEVNIGGTICQDNAACDSNATIGILTTTNTVLGTVTVNGSTSKSTSPIGSLSLTLNATPSALGSFTVSVSDTGFTNPTPPLTMTQTVGGTSGGVAASLSAVGFFGATNTIFDTGGAHTGTASTTLNAAANSASSGVINSGNPYSLTEVVTINVTALSTATSKDFQVNADLSTLGAAVPEPASISLLGSALLLGIGAIRRKTRRA